MARQLTFTQVFKIETGMQNSDGLGNDDLEYSSYTLLADSATEAIQKVQAWFSPGEFLVSIDRVCEVRLT